MEASNESRTVKDTEEEDEIAVEWKDEDEDLHEDEEDEDDQEDSRLMTAESIDSDESSELEPPPPPATKEGDDSGEQEREQEELGDDDVSEEDIFFDENSEDERSHGHADDNDNGNGNGEREDRPFDEATPRNDQQADEEAADGFPFSEEQGQQQYQEGVEEEIIVEEEIDFAPIAMVSRPPSSPTQEQQYQEESAGGSNPKKKKPKKYKTKIAYRLKRAVEDAAVEFEFSNMHRSSELVPLTKKYFAVRKRLRMLIKFTKEYHAANKKLDKARGKLFREYANLSKDTPLYDHVGKLLPPDALKALEKNEEGALVIRSDGLELSREQLEAELGDLSIGTLQQLAAVYDTRNAAEYERHVLEYVTEWEQIVTSKVQKGIQDVKKLQRFRSHYESKVEGLRKRVNAIEAKGTKEPPKTLVIKLSRNNIKLTEAFEIHEQQAGQLCVLLEEVTIHLWKDLYPLLKNAMKWEVNRLGRQNVTYGRFPTTLEAMKATFQDCVWRAKEGEREGEREEEREEESEYVQESECVVDEQE